MPQMLLPFCCITSLITGSKSIIEREVCLAKERNYAVCLKMHLNGDFIISKEKFNNIQSNKIEKFPSGSIEYFIKKFLNQFLIKSNQEIDYKEFVNYGSDPCYSKIFANVACIDAAKQTKAEKKVIELGESQGWRKPGRHYRLNKDGIIVESKRKIKHDSLKSLDAFNIYYDDVWLYCKHWNGTGGSQDSDQDVDSNEILYRLSLKTCKIKLLVFVYTGTYNSYQRKEELYELADKYGCRSKVVVFLDQDDPELTEFRNFNVKGYLEQNSTRSI